MQNRYVCDIGDFGKFGMLNYIFLNVPLRLGVNWYLYEPDENEKQNNDGKKIQYLESPDLDYSESLRRCDGTLFLEFQQIIWEWRNGILPRSVERIEKREVLPKGALFYRQPISSGRESPPAERKVSRQKWHESALDYLSSADVVFLDPDNGLEVASIPREHPQAGKYVYLQELEDYYQLGQSIILYNHRGRKPADEYMKRLQTIRSLIPDTHCFILRWRRGSQRDYIFILQSRHYEFIRDSANEFLKTHWAIHFEMMNIE